jgi:hypothetical protein
MEQLKLTGIIIIRVKCMKGHNLLVGLMILANLYHDDLIRSAGPNFVLLAIYFRNYISVHIKF